MASLQSTPPIKEVACCGLVADHNQRDCQPVKAELSASAHSPCQVLLSDVETRENKAGQQRLQLPADLMAGEGKVGREPLSWIQRQ
ncbi:hypothetical protein VP1G_10864 [Cytospora mali]|uniref:Uncharacterized protein n=1 Tax=Cytospora mali TaxID=578113 RepID=A0A194UXT9_CYTMA|nr:hypothetical protein VP1G_10864 [Valsa mali var. pyri (nom. inval.)]